MKAKEIVEILKENPELEVKVFDDNLCKFVNSNKVSIEEVSGEKVILIWKNLDSARIIP